MNILAIIPARSGSKSVADKNIREIGGIPMLAWSVRHALESRYINRVILSTDSEKYAAIGRSYGAETPFIRPEEYATDTALDIEVFEHALRWLKDNENYEADIVVQLRPTYPKRNPADIDKMIEMLINHPEADSVRSVAPAGEVPYKMWLKADEGEDGIVPLIKDIPECYNMPRQQLPKVYYQNACIDVMRGSTVIRKHSMTGDRILGYFMEENLDIDTEIEFLKAELEVMKNLKADAEPEIFEKQPENLQETPTAESGISEKQPENLQETLTAESGTSEKQPENLQETPTAESGTSERQPENLQETPTAESGTFKKQPENLQGVLTAESGTSERQPENLQETPTAESGTSERQPENLQETPTAESGTFEKQPENLQETPTAESEATKKQKAGIMAKRPERDRTRKLL